VVQSSLRRSVHVNARTSSERYASLSKCVARLDQSAVVKVHGKDAFKFLQGLTTNDLNSARTQGVCYTAFLNPKGRFLYDVFAIHQTSAADQGDTFLLQCHSMVVDDLVRYLRRYKLKSSLQIDDVSSSYSVWSVMSGDPAASAGAIASTKSGPTHGAIAFLDPRLHSLGARLLLPADDSRMYSVLILQRVTSFVIV